MDHRLYVGNLSDDVSIEALRKRFAACGTVTDVELATDRASGRMRGYAFVTMATAADARAAREQLNGATFDDRRLRVNEAGDERDASRAERGERRPPSVRITLQYRERRNMTYELDCANVLLSIKMFPSEADEEAWRIEATTRGVPGTADAAASASGVTRARALEEVGKRWREQNPSWSACSLDWAAITEALVAVRAI